MKKIDFIFIKDPHLLIGFNKPTNRQDTFFEEISKKWNFIINYAKKNNITNIIVTGDLFDKSSLTSWNFRSYLENKKFLENFKNEIGKSIYSIRGNHDEFNGKNTNENTVFGELVNNNLIKYFGDTTENYTNKISFKLENKTINLIGFDYCNEDKILYEKVKNYDFNENEYNICVLHSNVVDVKEGKEKFNCVGYDFLIKNQPKVNMWVLGHYHKGYPTKFYNNTYFINSWNLTRLARDNYVLNDEHTPEFVHVSFIEEDNVLKVLTQNIKVPFLPYKKAFYEDFLKLMPVLENDFKFFEKLEKENIENFDQNMYLEKLKEEKKLSKEIFDIIKEYLQ